MPTHLARIPAAFHHAATAVVRALDWCWYALLDLPPLRWLRAAADHLCAPLYRREARRAIAQLDRDLALIVPLGSPRLEAKLRQAQQQWVRRLTELG